MSPCSEGYNLIFGEPTTDFPVEEYAEEGYAKCEPNANMYTEDEPPGAIQQCGGECNFLEEIPPVYDGNITDLPNVIKEITWTWPVTYTVRCYITFDGPTGNWETTEYTRQTTMSVSKKVKFSARLESGKKGTRYACVGETY
jgi:hypothetical protein